MGKVTSIITVISIMMGMSPAIYAENNKTATIGDSEYILVDLKEKANCIGFADNGFTPESPYTVPDYLGVGRTSNIDGIDIIYNKIAMDNKKEENGLLYDNSGRPFMVNTDLDTPNFPLLGSGDYLKNQEITIGIDKQKLYEISFLADATYNVDAASFLMEIKYSDGTILKDSDWVIKTRNSSADAVLGYTGVDAYVGFNYVYPSDTDPDAALNSGIAFRPKNDKRDPLNVSYYFPVYTLKTDSTKTIESITIKQTGKYYGMAVLGMTLKPVTKTDEIKGLIDSLPDGSEINFGNYLEYKETVKKISEEIEKNNITLDSIRAAKLKEITEKIEIYENNPVEGINWLIDSLPEADEITEENCEEYLLSINAIKEKLNGEIELTFEKKEKFEAVSNAVELNYNKKTLKTLIDSLPDADEITKSNYSGFSDTLEKIQALLDESVTVDDERITKYNEIKEKINVIVNTYNPYVTFDFSNSANAIVFGEYGLSLDDVKCRTPFYLGAKNSNGTLSPYPTIVLNKLAFENKKASDLLIYSDDKEIPFEINTNYGIILGSDATDRLHSVTIPVAPGNYKNVSVAYAGTYEFEANQFEMKVEYTDGTFTTDPDWKIYSQHTNKDTLSKYPSVDDTIFVKYDSANGKETASYFERDDKVYTKLKAMDMYFPVITLETDMQKTVKSISFKQTDTWRALAIMGITGELVPQSDIKEIIESKIQAISKNNLAVEYENIVAIKNMIEKYKDSIGAEEISGLEEFEDIYAEFSNSVVEVEECETITTFDKTVTTVKFKNDILQSKLEELISVFLNGGVIDDYEMETVSPSVLRFTFKNDLDYNKEYKILISGALQSAVNSSFTLKNDYSYTFTPQAPFEILSFDITSEGGREVMNINEEKGKSIDVKIKLKNNSIKDGQKYGMALCLYGDNNKMIKVYLEQAELEKGEEKMFTYTLNIPEDEGNCKLACFVNDGYATMKRIVRSVIK